MGTGWSPVAVLVAVAVILLGGAGFVALVAYDEDDDPPPSEALPTLDETTTTTTTEAPTTSTTTAAVAGTSTSAPTTVRRTTTSRITTTTVRTTTTTARPGTTTTSGRRLCAVEQIVISVGTDSASYPAGRPVKMTTTILNKSSSPCYFRGYNVGLSFLDPAGRTVLGQVVHADAFEDAVFGPGQRITHDGTWDQRICDPCVQAPPGIYSVSADWSFSGGRYGATQQFILR